ncbi:uncharacterized protein LACBIDRAFT_317320 [Laccaria bicolor S238N-H82]|uniref:Predicted protein n=1 Tax=Laccaria bicolor (strain S238N-H82 / ATCC MYA-4686) TaxID=486041 RepID=B0D4X0_LACBS|nr:uncharacterized protein LACBIDRAFT_317320 [Laccaria bicolor S238N-H82]EDR10638.1 predicted protein [Laccaria bicolor S238N-H82]|eukprot:XP_001879088.1 predicted protein [Laccaria bicolor S238N-H82]
MLDRHLREDRHPAHSAEVPENMVPLRIDVYNGMDFPKTLWTLFLHEDIIAKTLAYERDLKTYRLNEIKAGLADPGRPTYDEVFGGCRENLHRWHCAPIVCAFGDVQTYPMHIYTADDCPGIEPYSSNQIPPIKTLLSIPFSLLHSLPRLTSIVSSSKYHSDLVTMGQEIVSLWYWDPLPTRSYEDQFNTSVNNPCNALPVPISNRSDTFEALRPSAHDKDHQQADPMQARPTFQSSSRLDLEETTPGTCQGSEAGLQSSTDSDSLDRSWVTGDADFGFFGYSECSSSTGEVKPLSELRSSDILTWANNVIGGEEKMLPLIATPYEKGIVGGSANDVLMVKGLIHPLVYIDYVDLEKFSYQVL